MLDGTLSTNSLSLAYLEEIVSSTGTASCSDNLGSSSNYAGCVATFMIDSGGMSHTIT